MSSDSTAMQHYQPKIYLAGFDVFRPDAVSHGAHLKELCAKSGMMGMYPFDNEIPDGLSGAPAADLICKMNIDMIQRCDAVLVNINNFRGSEPDSGSVFEFGYATALNKPVWGYCSDLRQMVDKIPCGPDCIDENGYHVENFGLSHNLMLACTWAGCSETAMVAVQELSVHLRAKLDNMLISKSIPTLHKPLDIEP